ncbi:hypothetical protein P5V15_004646 [Pogonomyrmex californicus]
MLYKNLEKMLYAHANLEVHFHMQTLIFILTIIRYNPLAYNIDSDSAIIFRDPVFISGRESYFGFSVALYAGVNESLLLVGAPRANSSAEPDIIEPGVVFKCQMNGICQEWMLDVVHNAPLRFENLINQKKDNSWFGATIAVQDKAEPRVVVCGPRWRYTVINESVEYMNGICYETLATNISDFDKTMEWYFLPFTKKIVHENITSVYNNYTLAQAGFSLYMNSKNDTDILLGSPGTENWKGDVVSIAISRYNMKEVKPFLCKNQEICANSYLGYAVTAGSYFDYLNKNITWYASSAPRGADLSGLVLVFVLKNNQATPIRTIFVNGQQVGEYFGAVLTSCDVNNDGRHELIVGAPQWSKNMDEGRVYIFTVRNNKNFEELQTIEGEIIGGRFGSAVMCLGDIDYDGYGDIAVGAPYEEESGGAVYIFNGNKDGISRKYSQRLAGSRFSPTLRGFGISISEPRDVNRDKYPDIAVGSYLSGEVVLFKSVPVVKLKIVLEPQATLLENVTSFVLKTLMSYDGTNAPERLHFQVTFKIDQLHRRAGIGNFDKNHNGIYTYSYEIPKLPLFIFIQPLIVLKKDIKQLTSPLEISASLKLNDAVNRERYTYSVMDTQHSKIKEIVKLPFLKDEDIPVSDLSVSLSTNSSSNNRYIIGSTEMILLYVKAYNRGKPAYRTKVRIVIEILTLARIPPECMENYTNSILVLICDIGDPLRTNKMLTLQLDMSMVKYDVREINLEANISTQTKENNLDDNSFAITVYFDVDFDLTIVGKARESLYSCLHEKRPPSRIKFQHFYEVHKFGVSPIQEAMLTIQIPTHIWHPRFGEVTIVNIKDVTGKMDRYKLHCSDSHRVEMLKKIASMHKNIVNLSHANNNAQVKFSTEENPLINVLSENRTVYINCTNAGVYCAHFDCRLRPFLNPLSVAKIIITLDLQWLNFPGDVIGGKDIIFYVTEGSIIVTQPYNIPQKDGHKSDITWTTFLGPPIVQELPEWIMTLSIFLGISLLLLLTLGLRKVGFFSRKRIDFDTLKAEDDLMINVV